MKGSSCAANLVIVQGLICLIAFLGKGQVRSDADRSASVVVHESVSRDVGFPKYISIMNFPVDIDSGGSIPQGCDLLGSQAWSERQRFSAGNSRSQNRVHGWNSFVRRRQHGCEWIFPEANAAPVSNLQRRCLSRVLDLQSDHWPPVWMGNPCVSWDKSGRRNWIGNINDSAHLLNHISPQLLLRRIAHSSQGPEGHNDSYNSCDEQSDIGKILRRKQTREVVFRAVLGTIALGSGSLLIYYIDSYSRHRLRTMALWVVGIILVAIGLGCFFLPVYWQDSDCKGSDKQRVFHGENYTLASLSGQNTGSIPSSHIS